MTAAVLSPPRSDALPVAVLLGSATLWGLSWWPLKHFAAAGLSGPVLALLTYGLVGVCTLVLLVRERHAWRPQTRQLIALAAAGGLANTAFVNALMLGDVVRVMLLFYLSPVWSVLGGKLFLGERIRPRRMAAVALALIGLWLVLGGSKALQTRLSVSDLLALVAGLAFAANNVIARSAQQIPMYSKTVAVFLGSGMLSAAALVLGDFAWPSASLLVSPLGLGLLAYGFGWLLVATATWQYGVTRIESGRAGIVMIAELLVGVVSAALIGDEHLSPVEWIGGALIASAALIEAIDGRDG